MAHRAGAGLVTFLVEQYRPAGTREELESLVARVRNAVDELGREGRAVRLGGSTIVPGDEAVLCVLEAASEQLVREAYARAGVPFERISPAIAGEETETRRERLDRESGKERP